MQILQLKETVAFMSYRKGALMFSVLLMLASVFSLMTNKLNFGLDFTGGTLIEVGFEKAADLNKIRAVMDSNGYPDAVVQLYGTSRDVVIRLAEREGLNVEMLGNEVLSALQEGTGQTMEMRRIEFVGGSVGDELAEQGGLAMLTALICILVYVAFRFEWRFALGSVFALFHDVLLTLGLFSVLKLEFDLTVLAAILAVIGYSLNDTIVVSDRIRENFRKLREGGPADIINISLTQTLSRTFITSITTLLVLAALFFRGGELIHGFATALLFGVFVGTYSSIYVASSVALAFGISKEDLIPEVIDKEGADQEEMTP
ncbi:preprotein translocase subunit SecF [Colwellia sp. PAMC 20917]|jgi:preprotein translocase subunit SecF|uniref:protein translocase subunit SecF n=1 Tax=unclassified Colwellia TaxID=196834 RepID=UPI000878A0DF|nr:MULTISPECIES: protein translocase subunit SecF [unclassified Colwellia]AOW77984.1 preprotein translocase subunit SecF [Colwellia sp. PAMC 20917]MBA6337208.1 protein translocase subunit SecF [Colwellia sp. BRX8-7]MBA6347727.1 protein translocase subunit SecF [Colwellia sp. BRX8-9]MBA6353850.1 protein translocase subunit SecF [Colwellia sp. BRX9-1]MBA6357879.1 protein translocase subunit SecF [Colwellia sp. BRX8-3]|tara:strand:+ start:4893 stop:5840 length:948 start_codon:yes stop_codon:yes gene_type:complete